ncbi:Ig-like domain repeat protein [Nocardioides mangrovi]|uniref:Ig-like domain-containing protein n=1 Tax=Nocardioides mangrovi TaxID=2874580 RepID=A0ABS7UB13_9ACTN|nr:Ig-like domain-containing protein [Nocardioides mangrovi]MBZ5738002.1 Ig-like domain-containing protein [Nocardioides mangrovi]
MRTRTHAIRRAVATAAASLVTAGLLAGVPGAAAAAPAAPSDWSVTAVAGGYQVSLDLDEPLPVVDDAPVLVVDGTDYGIATESADGLTLSIVTSDASVADADSVEMAWSSGTVEQSEPTDGPVTTTLAKALKPVAKKVARQAAYTDGSTAGPYSYVEDDYDFGDQAIPMAGIGGIRGEMTGRIYLPTTGGARPTVVLLHGRHTSCSTLVSGTQNPNRWPCVDGQIEVPSYKGYDALGQLLATHGYAVVSISANAINANDAQLTLDNGALARGQLVIDSLEMLKKATAGNPVSYYDAALDQTLTLDQALASTVPDSSGPIPTGSLTAADLVGRFDLSNVGIMGHSRGGEGVVSAVTLNQARANPFGINSVLPLAPVDFGRMTVTDTDMLVILPYCDGDVSNQQGQHFSDDSRYAFDDNALRSTVWVMGADHNFFNTIWTPGSYPYSSSDDWSPTGSSTRNDTVCSTSMAGNQRLSAADQSQTGAIVMSDWFRLTLGGEDEYLDMFDGSVKPALDSVPAADVRAVATAPADDRADIETFTGPAADVRLYGSATTAVCASASGRTLPQALPACATTSTLRSTSAMPHWTPASFAPNVPATPMTKFLWSNVTGGSAASIRVGVPASAQNASSYDALTFKTAPDESVLSGTDLTVTVVDGSGATWSTLVSAVNPLAVKRMPISGSTTLNKIVLQQVSIPVASMSGIDTSHIREVRFAAATGLDGTETGGVYLSDLAFSRWAVGTPAVTGSLATIGVAPTTIEEGSGPDTHEVAVVLSKPVATTVSGYFTLIGSTASTAKAGLAMEKVTFAPGETCQTVLIPTYGDSAASSSATTAYKMDVANPQGVITGDHAFDNVTIREDDGLTAGSPIPAVGEQGDACAEYAAQSRVFPLDATATSVTDGTPVTLTATGYRVGETVTFAEGGAVLGTVLADADGSATVSTTVTGLGAHAYTATGAGSLRDSAVTVTVLAPTATSLGMSPATPSVKQPVTLTATVTGNVPWPTEVVFTDGATRLGTAQVVDGTAVLSLPGGFAVGSHSVVATLPATTSTTGSTSEVLAFTLAKGVSTTMLSLSSPTTTYGTGATGTVTVAGADGGTVTVGYNGTETELALGSDGTASFELPASLAVGSYQVTASYSGSDSVGSSTAAATAYAVTKAGSTSAVTAKSTVKKGKSLAVAVTVAGVDGVDAPTGKVTVTFLGVTKKVTLVDGAGKATFKATKTGKRKISVAYAGDESYAGSTAGTTVKVVKK